MLNFMTQTEGTPWHVEHLTANTNTVWPFVEDSPGITYEEPSYPTAGGVMLPADFLVDMVIGPRRGSTSTHWQLSGMSITGVGALMTFRDTVYPAQSVIFDVSTFPTSGYRVIQGGTGTPDGVGLLVIHPRTEQIINSLRDAYGTGNLPLPAAHLVLNPAVLSPTPRAVRSLEPRADIKQALTDPSDDGGFRRTGDIKLVAGYNIQLDVDVDANGIRIDAVPGAGLGQLPCASEPVPLTGSSIPPDTFGNVEIESSECYEVETDREAGTIRIKHLCDPCCDCEDYIAVGELYNQVRAQYLATHTRVTTLAQAVLDKLGCLDTLQVELEGAGGGLGGSPELLLRVSSGGAPRGYVMCMLLNKTCEPVTVCRVQVQITSGATAATYCLSGWYLYESDVIQVSVSGSGAGPYRVNTCPNIGPCVTIPPGKGMGVLFQFANLSGVAGINATAWNAKGVDGAIIVTGGTG